MRIMSIVTIGLFIFGTAAANAGVIELYSAEDFQYSGTGAIGSQRSQQFSPSESTPNSANPLNPAEALFDSVGMKFKMGAPGENATITLSVFSWQGNYASTLGSAPLAQQANINLPSGFENWIDLSLSTPQPTSGQYLISAHINSMTYINTGFGVWRSNSNDGGPNNTAYNGSTAQSNREYQVRLNVVPEPASLALFGLGAIALLRRR